MTTVTTVVQVAGPVRVARVPSASRPGEAHKVLLACDCEGFKFMGHCRHLFEAATIVREDARAARQRTRERLSASYR